MPDFVRIADVSDPMAVLNAPMEAALIPEVAPAIMRLSALNDGPVDRFEASQLRASTSQVRNELYQRYATGLRALCDEVVPRSIGTLDDHGVGGDQEAQRALIRLLVEQTFPGLDTARAIRSSPLCRDESKLQTIRRQVLTCLLSLGYCPPVPAADLYETGTTGAPEGYRQAPRAIVERLARAIVSRTEDIPADLWEQYRPSPNHRTDGSLRAHLNRVEDNLKQRVERPWSEGIFDRDYRIWLFLASADSAYNRAYDEVFLWPDPMIIDCSKNTPGRKYLFITDQSARHRAERQAQHRDWQERLLALESRRGEDSPGCRARNHVSKGV